MTTPSVRHIHRGTSRLVWATTVASLAAPTVAEINAGTDVSQWVARLSGWRVAEQTVELPVAQSDYGSIMSARATRKLDGVPSIGFYDEGTVTETLRDTTLAEDASGFVIWLPYGPPTTGDRCAVWPVESLGPRDNPNVEVAAAGFSVGFTVRGLPILDAEVA